MKILLTFLLLGSALALGVLLLEGCGLFANRPATAGARLALCSEGPAERYTACCLSVAKDYPLNDGGPRDTTNCYLDGGR